MTPRILIADDEDVNRFTLEAILSRDGYDLHFANDGQEACDQARLLQPDLILLDVMMPVMDGFAVCRRVRQDPVIGRVPIILITALHDEESRLEGLRAGADDFLTKPCANEELRARVRTVASLNRFRAIAEQSARFQQLFELTPAAIVLVDEHGVISAANSGAKTLLGLGAGGTESVYVRFDDAAGHALRETVTAACTGACPSPIELRRRVAEQELVMQVRAVAVREASTLRVMLILDDITTEVRAREALLTLNTELDAKVRARTRQLEDANNLLMSYAGFVSHDLRSPLAVMKGYLSLLREGVVPVGADAAPMIEQAYNASVMMEDLVRNILQLAKDEHQGQSSATREPVDPRPVIGRLITHLRQLHREPAPTFLVGELPLVGVSAVMVERVFYNLLSNALKFSAHTAAPRIEIGAAPSADGPVLFVRDNGVGFDARDADKLFREFSQLPNAKEGDGFGLGLSLVARMLRAHGGRIWAEGETGSGATFYVQFPAPVPLGTSAPA
jgi:hypothetical protein